MLDWFKTRKQRQAVDATMGVMVRLQFTISGEEPANHTDDPWTVGYVFGALTGLLQLLGLEPGPQALPLMERGFKAIYGGAGPKILQRAFEMRGNAAFAEAQLIGASEILAAQPGAPAPFGLGSYLGSANGLGDESQVQVRQRVRQRAMQRMTPDAFQRALDGMTAQRKNG